MENFLDHPKVMGILNITPDSFFDGGRYLTEKAVLNRVEQMLKEGADIIDIGAFSSRPGADLVTYHEEKQRLIPFLKVILKTFPGISISIDTFRHQIAKEAIEAGATIINDISGGELDPEMFNTIAQLNVPYIMMHMRGTPKTMQKQTNYVDIVNELKNYFDRKITQLNELGFKKIIIDLGFGFGKTLEQNYYLLANLIQFKCFGLPILVGISRKSMLYKALDITPDNALNASIAANAIALERGANILRVHDVKAAVETVKIYELVKQNEK